MRWNPFYNATGAAAYIAVVVSLMHLLQYYRHDTPDTFFDIGALLSLLVLSVATMAFLFFYRPLTLILDNRREEAVRYFFQTLGVFAVCVFVVLAATLAQ